MALSFPRRKGTNRNIRPSGNLLLAYIRAIKDRIRSQAREQIGNEKKEQK